MSLIPKQPAVFLYICVKKWGADRSDTIFSTLYLTFKDRCAI